jgi:hypothetical protein
MTRRRVDIAKRLVRQIGVRLPKSFYEKMEGWLANSNCRSVSELARAILCKEEIIWYHKDASRDAIAIEPAAIRKELHAIEAIIYQVRCDFNQTQFPDQKVYEALKILDEYRKVGDKVQQLETVLKTLHEKWLQK